MKGTELHFCEVQLRLEPSAISVCQAECHNRSNAATPSCSAHGQNMKIDNLRLVNIRCFEDTGNLGFSPDFNIIVGRNNSGKSTCFKAISGLQMNNFDMHDARPGSFDRQSFSTVMISDLKLHDTVTVGKPPIAGTLRVMFNYWGAQEDSYGTRDNFSLLGHTTKVFPDNRPDHAIVLFSAAQKRNNSAKI